MRMFFFEPVRRIFSVLQSVNGLSNRIWARITWPEQLLLHKRVRVVALFQKPVQTNTEEEYPAREKRVDAEFLSLFENRFILTCSLYINSPLNYVICRAPSIFFHVRECYESERVHSFSTHEIWKQKDKWLWQYIFCMCFVCSSWYFYSNKGCLWHISSVALLNINCMCLLVIESKSTRDHTRKLLQALDDGLKWVSKYINNYIHFQV